MAEQKNRVQAGRLLSQDNQVWIYELSTAAKSWNALGDVEMVTAAFNQSGVAVRVSRDPNSDGSQAGPAQVVLSRSDFLKLIASYRAFERAEKRGAATPPADDYDPFLDAVDKLSLP